MKKVVLILVTISILTIALFTLTGCSITFETDENSVSAKVDDETKGTFESIVDWVVERLDRIFVTEDTENEGESASEDTSESI